MHRSDQFKMQGNFLLRSPSAIRVLRSQVRSGAHRGIYARHIALLIESLRNTVKTKIGTHKGAAVEGRHPFVSAAAGRYYLSFHSIP